MNDDDIIYNPLFKEKKICILFRRTLQEIEFMYTIEPNFQRNGGAAFLGVIFTVGYFYKKHVCKTHLYL